MEERREGDSGGEKKSSAICPTCDGQEFLKRVLEEKWTKNEEHLFKLMCKAFNIKGDSKVTDLQVRVMACLVGYGTVTRPKNPSVRMRVSRAGFPRFDKKKSNKMCCRLKSKLSKVLTSEENPEVRGDPVLHPSTSQDHSGPSPAKCASNATHQEGCKEQASQPLPVFDKFTVAEVHCEGCTCSSREPQIHMVVDEAEEDVPESNDLSDILKLALSEIDDLDLG